MSNEVATVTQNDAELAAIAATKNDLSLMTEAQRAQLYGSVCRSIGLNPLTSPFEYIKLNGKLTLYAKKGATDQIRDIRGISITNIDQKVYDGVLMVTATAQDAKGRIDSDIGAVVVKGLAGEALANAYMKAITKAKRRVTLSLAGLGFLDESEVESIPAGRVQPANVDHQTGRMTGTVESLQGEVVDDDGVIEDNAIEPGWDDAARYFATLIDKKGISDAEGMAMLRKWGIPSARVQDMSTEKLQQACKFLESLQDAKLYGERALADEKEMAKINSDLKTVKV